MAGLLSAVRLFAVPIGWLLSLIVSVFFLVVGLSESERLADTGERLQWIAVVGVPWAVTLAAVAIWWLRHPRRFPDLFLLFAPGFLIVFFAVGSLLTKF